MTDPKPPRDRNEQHEQEKWYERTRYQIVLFAGGIALFGFVLWVLQDLYIDPQTSAQRKDLVQALGLILAGVAGAIGIFFTWRGQRITRESLESSRENTEKQLQLTREGQITERFTKAIEQLGATDDQGRKSLELRLGGIYALERIARESEEDYWPIMEVLTAYVRQHAPWRPEEGQGDEANTAVEKKSVKDSRGESVTTEVPTPDPDIQAIMTVLRRRTRFLGGGEPEPFDLRKTHLSRADLRGADLRKANLAQANLHNASLREANLHDASLWRANLIGANLTGANLTGANLSGAILREASLMGANLTGVILREANLSRADLPGARLLEARLLEARLWGANLSGANLSGADLSGARLSRADLLNANLSGANLSGAHLTQAQLEEASGDETTRLPSDLKPPAHWGVKTDEQTEED